MSKKKLVNELTELAADCYDAGYLAGKMDLRAEFIKVKEEYKWEIMNLIDTALAHNEYSSLALARRLLGSLK